MSGDDVRAAISANRDVEGAAPGPYQDCRDVVHISIFFDGTGNNLDADEATASWSNIGRMFDAAVDDPAKGIYSIYISGVGTKFNGTLPNWLAAKSAMIEDGLPGMGLGAGGDRRMEFGYARVNDRLRDFLILNAQKQGGDLEKYANEAGNKSFSELNRALGRHRLIKTISISVFGFSRGAALARAFTNRIIKQCTDGAGSLLYSGYPLRINFLGVFDTVASFGVPSQNARTPFTERELLVSPKVERCVHYVAAHEVRFAFPVDLIRKNGKLQGGWVEKLYPGVHSDVGGGYEPTAQGIDNNYARIPMRDMMAEAVGAGVRLRSYGEIARTRRERFTARFECRNETAESYRRYMAYVGSPSGPIEGQIKQHMKLLYSAYGTMHRRGMETPGQRRLKEDKYKYIGPKGMAWEVGKYRFASRLGKAVRIGGGVANSYAQFVKPQDWQLECWDSNAPDGVLHFVAQYVHDSKVDFIVNLGDPFSYFSAREVLESTISVWAVAGNWLDTKTIPIRNAVNDGIERSKQTITKAVDSTTAAVRQTTESVAQAAREKALLAKRKAVEAADVARRELLNAKKFGSEVIDEAANTAQHAAGVAQQRAEQAATYAEKLARDAEAAAVTAVNDVQQRASKTSEAASVLLAETADGAERLLDSGIVWIKKAVRDSTDDAESKRR
ncbi:DUF2235 domain-containing protein [Pseudoduganella sp. SL102]|uniref:T6SS phospholipase effector Tle1-like catalytic domain-containing protein n=1 Tax=Pseudoduganella sp. SL102 TaxID=2995154 RepID=UPI00248CBC13|nr:DUF2235 domain-containing protein [Pseudoduganella sp. SL102]WBS04822.1 DUF2235 domain-containing protein [Pseudoduganella sp. SL102]